MMNTAPQHQSLGSILLRNNSVQVDELEAAEEYVRESGASLQDYLLTSGACSEDDVLTALAEYLQLPRLAKWLELHGIPAVNEPGDTYELENSWWQRQKAFPLGEFDDVIWVALADVHDNFVPSVLRRKTGKKVQPVITSGHELRLLHSLIPDLEAGRRPDDENMMDLATGAPTIKFVNDVIQRAVDVNASDIHFESYRGIFRVRIRVDGVMHEIDRPGITMAPAILSRLKLMANLDISERRLPQDGRIRIRISGRELDIRVATTPGVAGESVVLRLLDRPQGVSELKDLDMFSDHEDMTRHLLGASNGILLVTGPTGSGKTTSLYTFLSHVMGDDRKIITVEDPVEYQTSGITQIQVQSEIGLTFASVLRSVLRQDPDIILVGEIRDGETAEIAVQAALTGHLVLSTLHTNDAPSSFVRLNDMGVEPYLLASSVIGVMAQRLVRQICPHCSTPDHEAESSARSAGFDEIMTAWPNLVPEPNFRVGAGCDMCLNTGYSGRRSIFEMFELDEALRHIVSTNPDQVRNALKDKNFRNLRQDGLLRAALGQTTVTEVMRVIG